MKKYLLLCGGIAALSCLVGCKSMPGESNPTVSAEWCPQHVIFVGFDGLCAQSIREGADVPTLRNLMSKGASTLESRTILPSSSACDWASIFMGSGIELHGYIQWGSKEPELTPRVVNENGRYPDIFWEYHKKNPSAEIGYIYEWEGMNYLTDPAATDFRQQTTNCTAVAVQYIKEKKPNLCAIIYDQPDGVGHNIGWRTPEYLAKVHELDGCLNEIMTAIREAGIEDETVVIVTSDHGGIEKGHGGTSMSEMQRPLVIYGKNVKENFTITDSTVVYDIGPTIGWLLGVESPQVWTGRPIQSAFKH